MAVDQVLKRNFWVVILVLTGVAAFFGASGVTQIIGIGLAADEKQLTAPPLAAKSPAAASSGTGGHSTSADPILSRNPFDSVTGPLNKVAAADESAPEAAPDLRDPYSAPACDGVKVLIIAASPDENWSFAALSSGGDNSPSQLRRRGGEFNGKTVEYVRWDRVWFTSGGSLCQAQLFKGEEAKAPPAPPPPPPTAPVRGGAPTVDPSIAKGIQKVSATEFNIDRGVVDKILENQAELMRQARIVPVQENGKVVGINLFGVRPDTLLGQLGMENGDRLQQINGFDMASPEKALEAYARLRMADHLTVQINRRGQNVNLDYNIK
ncbi:type II secretion system protein GspC [Pendulispora albinea]|uniref:General secretion pathway protein GspC n=1 Tax=Pendulispora albinea TaxID=2741071 RepID=A0ABZ2LNP8_9BACT